MSNNKFQIQHLQYHFPYHYIPHMEGDVPQVQRTLQWGWEYLSYMNYTIQKILEFKVESHLDIGCGDGFLINHLPGTVPYKLGVDLSDSAIKFAKAFSPTSESFRNISIEEVDKRFDSISLIEVLEHIPDNSMDNFLSNSFNCVKKGGYIFVSVPSTDQKLHKKHFRHYTNDLLDSYFPSKEFEKVESTRLYNPSLITEILLKLSCNKYFSINIRAYRSYCWRRVQNELTHHTKGHHIFGIWKKI